MNKQKKNDVVRSNKKKQKDYIKKRWRSKRKIKKEYCNKMQIMK